MALTGLIYNTSKENDREQWRRSLAEAGLTLVAGSFEEGAVATKKTDAVWYMAGGQCCVWDGALPKDVPAKSTPASTGGFSEDAWGVVKQKTPLNLFNTAKDMLKYSGIIGQVSETLGFHEIGDGGAARYVYTTKSPDGMLNLACNNVTATIQHNGAIALRQVGAVPDFDVSTLTGTDCHPFIMSILTSDAVECVIDGHYALKTPLTVPKRKLITGNTRLLPIRENNRDAHGISGVNEPRCSLQLMMPTPSTDNGITLSLYSAISNIMLAHPLQSVPPVAMAPSIFCPSLGAEVNNVMLNSSWLGIKVKGNGNVRIHDVYGTALGGGLIDLEQVSEVCDISNIHAWKWWAFSGWEDWSLHNAVVLRLGNVDGSNIRGIFGLQCKHVVETYLASGLTATAVNNYAWANIEGVVADVCRIPVKIGGANQLNLTNFNLVGNPLDIQGGSCILVDAMPEKGVLSINGVNGYNAGYLLKITNDASVYGGNISISGNARIGTSSPGSAATTDTGGISTLAVLNQSDNLHVRIGAIGVGALSMKQSIGGKNVWVADVNSQQQTTGTQIVGMNDAANWTGDAGKFSFADEGIYSNNPVAGVSEIRFLLPASIKVLSLDCLCGWFGVDAASLSSMLYGIDVVENNLVSRVGALWPVATWPKIGVSSRIYKEFTLDPAKRYQIRYRFNQGGLTYQFLTKFSGYYTV